MACSLNVAHAIIYSLPAKNSFYIFKEVLKEKRIYGRDHIWPAKATIFTIRVFT